jgi:hypothetical protein
MNAFLKTSLFSLVLLLGSGTVYAQRGGGDISPADQAKKQTEKMAEQLSLTDEQKEEVLKVNLKFAEISEAARAGGRPDRETMKTAQATQKAELKAVLTEDQFKALEALQAKEESGNRGGKRGGGKRGGGRG